MLSRIRIFLSLFLLAANSYVFGQASNDDYLFVDQDIRINTRDGIPLSAIFVYDKRIKSPLPTALNYTVYVNEWDLNVAMYAAQKGYASVLVYSRGVKTEGVDIIPYEHDAEDVYDVLNWITQQPWSDGRVGMYGGSYSGLAQWSVARLNHPALKTIVPQASAAPGISEPYENNVFITQLAYNWPLRNVYGKQLPGDFYSNWYRSGEPYQSLDKFSGETNPLFHRWLEHPYFDDYWRSITTDGDEFKSINIPVLTTTGYYDDAQVGALYYFKEHLRNNNNVEHYLVIGPYDHVGAFVRPSEVLRGYKIDPVANESMSDLVFDWFDYVFKDQERPDLIQDKVNYQIMGKNEWAHAASLGQMATEKSRFYLNKGKSGDYHLLSKASGEITGFSQVIDFSDRGTENNLFTPLIINKNPVIGNGIAFATGVFDRDTELNGEITGELNVIINKKDLDISFALYEEMPDGNYFLLNRYVSRASYAKNRSNRELINPGEKYTIPINNSKITSRLLSKGSRLLFVLDGNKNPYEEINIGTGGGVSAESLEDNSEPLEIEWLSSSYIDIPLKIKDR